NVLPLAYSRSHAPNQRRAGHQPWGGPQHVRAVRTHRARARNQSHPSTRTRRASRLRTHTPRRTTQGRARRPRDRVGSGLGDPGSGPDGVRARILTPSTAGRSPTRATPAEVPTPAPTLRAATIATSN